MKYRGNMKKNYKIFSVLWLLCNCFVYSQGINTSLNSLQWYSDEDTIACTVKELAAKDGGGNQLSFYKNSATVTTKIYDTLLIEPFLSMFPLDESSRFMVTVWMGPTNYHIIIYRLERGKIIPVFEDQSNMFPEFINSYETGMRNPYVLLTVMEWDVKKKCKAPRYAKIYKWTGEKFVLYKKTPWQDRLKSIVFH